MARHGRTNVFDKTVYNCRFARDHVRLFVIPVGGESENSNLSLFHGLLIITSRVS